MGAGKPEEGGAVLKFPGLTRPAPDERPTLERVPHTACRHHGSYIVDTAAARCKCAQCGAEVAPMFVLDNLLQQESRWMAARKTYHEQMQRLNERTRCKCQHCGLMTRLR